ncbi:MAG: ATP-grasp domain-containing protein [Kofleriaceae bacterium]|nr:ATP-grasp domain-containing protein [Kofleriaceae bacterium]
MRIRFCRPAGPQSIDDRFDLEIDALDELGIAHDTISMESVVDDELDLTELSLCDDVLYRGWMLTAEEYERLASAVADVGGTLVTSPEEYEAAHYLPSWYAAVADDSPATRWTDGTDLTDVWEAACAVGGPPLVVKDHVKSVKEQWSEACYVPPGATREDVTATVHAMIDARGERFERGVAVRRYIPLAYEHRVFFWQGALVAEAPYLHDVEPQLPPSRFVRLGRVIDSPFFSADLALTHAGTWIVLEIGDGGVSTLPPTLDVRAFYRAIARACA